MSAAQVHPRSLVPYCAMAPEATTSQAVQQAILQALYALFLGGIITAFLVVGLNTFYPPPEIDNDAGLQLIRDRESEIHRCTDEVECTVTQAEEAELLQLEAQREEIYDQHEEDQQLWSRNAGLVLIGLATGLLALSLIRWDRAIVLSNGLLLGGLFTMVGGILLTVLAGQGLERFLVLTLALALTVSLGYVRFARRSETTPVTASSAEVADAGLDGRVAALENRIDDMRRALGG